MKNETDFKKAFCDSVHKQGGFTFKIAASIMSGLPDIYCAMPGFVPVLLEAKWIKDVTGKFIRKIPYRPYQQEILKNCSRPYKKLDAMVAFGLIGVHNEHGMYCRLLPPTMEVITSEHIQYGQDGLEVIIKGGINVHSLFENVVPQIAIDHEDVALLQCQQDGMMGQS
jgi:hypothetical protein